MKVLEKFCEIYESKLEERKVEVIDQDKLKFSEHTLFSYNFIT